MKSMAKYIIGPAALFTGPLQLSLLVQADAFLYTSEIEVAVIIACTLIMWILAIREVRDILRNLEEKS